MEDLTAVSPVHLYDTRSHQIACGRRGFDQRSTKHPRLVTCHACVALLRSRPSLGASGVAPTAGAAR
jgi:hypothetical protein